MQEISSMRGGSSVWAVRCLSDVMPSYYPTLRNPHHPARTYRYRIVLYPKPHARVELDAASSVGGCWRIEEKSGGRAWQLSCPVVAWRYIHEGCKDEGP